MYMGPQGRFLYECLGRDVLLGHQAPVVQALDSAIHRINHNPADK